LDDRISAPEGIEGLVYTTGDANLPFVVASKTFVQQDFLGLGDLAYRDQSEFSTLNTGIGTGANELVQLDEDAKLPAVDGSQLTNIQKEKYIRLDYALTAGGAVVDADHGGLYDVADAWQTVPLNTLVYNPDNIADYDAVDKSVTLPAGTYYIKAWTRFRINGVGTLRISYVGGGVVTTGGGQYTEGTESRTEATAFLTISEEKELFLEFSCSGADSGEYRSMGTARASMTSIFASIEIWKQP
jgi:hypothetical protein